MEFFRRRQLLSPLLLVLVYFTYVTYARSHHIRHHRDRFKRQQGAHLYLPGSYVTDGDDDPDAGPWLEWSSPSQCSRTCGGGVSTQYRQCTPNYRCRGPTRRHFSCNTQDCPDLADFRALQCAKFDPIPFEGALYEWVPYTKSPQPCELNCMPRGERFYYRHKLQVVDGTRCNDESVDVCVEGKCQPVGCDMMLGSDAREDHCRVCEGNGSTCNTMQGLLDMQDLQVGYNDILLIPSGAVNIIVKEVDRSNNYLAIRNATGHYYLNGNWRIDFPRTLDFAGSKFHYERSPQGFSAPDTISCLGPIEESLFIVLLYQDRNVGIHYEYSIPKTVQSRGDTETYAWTFDQFTTCTASCGGGYQSRNVSCAGRKSLEPVETILCDANNKPVETQKCGEIPCDPEWVAKDWTKCSSTCGDGGNQTRQIYCEQIISSGVPSIVDDGQCANLQKPPAQQACNQGVVCGEWHTGPWKPCNRLCGKGKETRDVTCYRKVDGKITVLEESECAHEQKPDASRSCLLRPCEGVDWVVSEWSGCENKCGLSEETRSVQCMTASGDVFPDNLCAEDEEKPETIRQCTSKGCDYEWYASQWSECSAKCGSGVQTRKVVCTKITDDGFKKVEASNCVPSKKYDAVRNCTAEETECPGEWFTGPWTKCTKDCGGGIKTRKVLCIKGNTTAHVKECDPDLTSSSSEECNKQACDKDEVIPVDVTKIITSTTEEPSELEGDDEYEIVEDDECEDGVWVDANGIPQRKLGPSEKLQSAVSKSLGESTDTDSKMQAESSLAEDDLMLRDSPFIGDADSGNAALEDIGSGDYATFGTAPPLPASFVFSEGSGDIFLTTFEGSGEDIGLTEVTETVFQTNIYTLGSSLGTYETFETTDEPDRFTATGIEETGTTDFTVTYYTDMTTEEPISKETVTYVTDASSESPASEATGTTDATSETSGITTEETDTGATEVTSKVSEGVSEDTVTDVTGITTEVITSEKAETDLTTITGISSEVPVTDATDISSKEPLLTTDEAITHTTDISSPQPGLTSETSITDATAVTSEEETGITTEKLATDVTEITGITTEEPATDVTPIVVATTEEPATDATQTTVASTDESTGVTTESVTPKIGIRLTSAFAETTITGAETTSTAEEVPEISSEAPEITATRVTVETTAAVTGAEETTVDKVLSTTEEATKISKESTTTEEADITTEVKASEPTTEAKDTDATTEAKASEATTEARESEPTTEETTEITTEEATKEPSASEVTTESIISTTVESVVSGVVSVFTRLTGLGEDWTTSSGVTDEVTTVETITEAENVTDTTEETTEELTEKTTEYDIWSSTESTIISTDRTSVIELFTTPKIRWCKRPRKPKCMKGEFGCCSDKITFAKGPFDKGCPIPKTCEETKYGCCQDGVSPAVGNDFKGCPISLCDQTLFGCCPDNKTPSQGNNNEGCPPPPPECTKSKFGCCEDNATEATGPNGEGCKEKEEYTTTDEETTFTTATDIEYTTTEREDCNETAYGCCPDNVSIAQGESFKGCDLIHPTDCNKSYYKCCPDGVTSAQGTNYQGCEIECLKSAFGCCADGVTSAHGYNKEGCCLNTQYGCCSDNIKPAEGPKQEGCGCVLSAYGCCPDNVTPARGHNKEGCGCEYTEHGCCPDANAEARGPDYQGCACHTFQFGCCPDGVTTATGLRNEGCGCVHSEFGCCSDEKTAATGANFAGCDCLSSKYGCCPDGQAEAQGENFEGCVDAPEDLQANCQLAKDRGTCRNYTVRWFYDMEYGGCSRFWYGGCDGNGNRFKSKDDCNNVCVESVGKDRCNLPKVSGPCEGYYPQWYYDKPRNLCTQFIYGGCLGNNNRFETIDECNELCVTDSISDPCEQPQEAGPCHGDYINWYYNKESGYCEQFIYGGCKGNNNNFPSEASCKQRCAPASEKKPSCALPKVQGECTELLPRWYYSSTEERCMPFYYTGCSGNSNNFMSQYHCELDCPKRHVKEICQLPADSGECSNYASRFYYDTRDKACKHFYYGGCGGNKNNFISEGACMARCQSDYPQTEAPPAPPVPVPEIPVTTEGPEPFKTEYCYLNPEAGTCRKAEARWHYKNDGTCQQFVYGGCGGNRNNFMTSDECYQSCGHAEDVCNLPMVPGPCNADYAAWYYNQTTNTCQVFKFGGCMGNGNKFSDLESCERQCKKDVVTYAPEVQPTYDPTDPRRVCLRLVEPGTCNETIPSFYYDANSVKCAAFTYTGCGGNENRFTSIESCERFCGKYRGHDACSLPSEIGPCRGYFTKYFFDVNTGTCQEFLYGGCEGNANRYSTVDECYSVCGSRQPAPQPERTTAMTPTEICLLTADTGTCLEGSQKRWYYDNTKGECIAFIFSGCGGNANNFYSHNDCLQTCRQFIDNVYEPAPAPEPAPEEPDVCIQYQHECSNLRCQYGMKGYVENLCNRCKCVDPCEGVTCSLETRCEVELNRNQTYSSDISTFVGVCREVNKPGDCPYLHGSGDECREHCKDDADCLMDLLCCSNGCGHVCVMPSVTTISPPGELRTTILPGFTQRPLIRDTYPPEVIEEEFSPVVTAGEGDYATLKCVIRGNPHPTFTWSKDDVLIDGKEPRYRILLEGAALQIISLYKTDAGIYLCSADNKIGKPLKKEIRLEVIVPVRANITLSTTNYPVGSVVNIPCDVEGFPIPTVQWYKDGQPLYPSHLIQITESHRLIINNVTEADSAEYRCAAWNQYSNASSTIPLLIQGRFIHPRCKDNPFFANCPLIIKANFCSHKYYARFCCRSCTEAGMLPSVGPHLGTDSVQNDQNDLA